MSNPDRVREIFSTASELPSEQRAKYLDSACGDDPALRVEVESLLKSLEESGPFLSAPTSDLPARDSLPTSGEAADASAPAAPRWEGVGSLIGPYKLLQLIGEGGFGSVFMAEQSKPVSRRVALKVIKLGMDTNQVVARFEQERQALAIMDHPNIAKVFDAGATATGRPYFAMELCKGDPISEYCDRHSLTIHKRLELFAQVCTAVQHAHTKGVIHRDIKPSNILVSTQDGRPHAKIIDFGIAKATASKLTERTLFTEHRQLIGTPEYMSPEQAEGSLDIDTRTDVYSLGVLLYELLTGSTPFSATQLRSAAYAEIQRIIREVDPPDPSTRLSQNSDTIASVAACRKTEPRRLGTIVRGELDWIVMKALEKDRQRRYETADGLAMDIRRYLAGEPVVAAPPGRLYRVRKLIRRNRVWFTAASLVAAALVLGIIGTSYGLVWAIRERDHATQEASRAKALNNFMRQMVLSANPEDSGDRGVTVADMLSKASVQADSTLRDEPIAEGEARTFLADTLRVLGHIDQAEKEARRALELREKGPERNTLQDAESIRVLAMVLRAKGQYKDELAFDQQALSIMASLKPPLLTEVCIARFDLAQCLIKLGKFAEAEKSLDDGEPSLARLNPARPDMRADYLAARGALVLGWHGDLDKAEAIQTQQIAMRRELPSKHLLADAINDLAIIKMRRGDSAAAIALYQECLDIQRNEFGDTHQTVATTLENMANVYYSRKEYDQAISRLDEVLAIRTTLFGAESFPVARTRFNTGVIADVMGDHARALGLIDGALAVFRKNLDDKSPEIGQALRNRAICLKGLGRLDEALYDARAALAIFDAAVDPTERSRIRAIRDIAELLCLKGSPDEAERVAKQAIAVLDPQKPDQAKAIQQLNDQLAKCRSQSATPPPAPESVPRPATGK